MFPYLDGYIYHMVHVKNLRSIFQQQVLLSKNMLRKRGIGYISIANEQIQNLRDRIRIQVFPEGKSLNLHSYVPFYFTSHTPMLSAIRNKIPSEQIAFLEVPRSILTKRGVIFTDGNATCQQLSRSGTEIVLITPASLRSPCKRCYIPDGPHGTGESISNFYSDIMLLKRLNWRAIEGGYTGIELDERRRIRCAEVLIPNAVPVSLIKHVIVYNEQVAQEVKADLARLNVKANTPSIVIGPAFYTKRSS